MDSTRVGNHYMDEGIPTDYPCVRCIYAWAVQDPTDMRYLGKTGCFMPQESESNSYLFDSWINTDGKGNDHRYKRCFRCFNKNQECLAAPEDFDDECGEIAVLANWINTKEGTRRVKNPAWKEGAPDDVPRVLEAPCTYDSKELKEFGYRLRAKCTALVAKINTHYLPHRDHLVLHSGAYADFTSDGPAKTSPRTAMHPLGRARDKQTLLAQTEAKKRSLEAKTAKLESAESSGGTPRKRMRTSGFVAVKDAYKSDPKYIALHTQLVDAQAERSLVSGKEKSALTRKIKDLEKKLDVFRN